METYGRYRVLWPDHLGLARGKYLPERSAGRGTGFCVGVFLQGLDKGIYEVETGIDANGFPDLDAEFDLADARPGWEDDTGVVIADLSFQHQPFEASARRTLQRAVADWEALGYRPKIGIELEAYLLEPTDGGGWQAHETPAAYVYGTGPMTDPTGLIDEIMRRAAHSGIPVESLNTEFDSPQFELTLEYDDAVTAVDNVFLFKELARETAFQYGLKLTFLGKPLAGRAGSGLHVNLSLSRADGTNAYHEPDAEDGLSPLARRCIAGLLAHHEGLAALCASNANAYQRLVPGELVGQWANWGYDHRCVAVRVPPQRGDGTRLEHRLPDGAANPYVATAAVLQAARLGVMAELDPPAAETGDGMEVIGTDRRCATDLAAALDALEADGELTAAVGSDLVANLIGIKRLEVEARNQAGEDAGPDDRDGTGADGSVESALTAWDRTHYLPYF